MDNRCPWCLVGMVVENRTKFSVRCASCHSSVERNFHPSENLTWYEEVLTVVMACLFGFDFFQKGGWFLWLGIAFWLGAGAYAIYSAVFAEWEIPEDWPCWVKFPKQPRNVISKKLKH